MKKVIVMAWVTLALALAFGTPVAEACSTPPPQPPITIEFHEMCFPIDDPTDCMLRGWITFHNYTTFGSSGGTFCACALSKVGKIKQVLWAKFVDPTTGERYDAWAFDENSGVTVDAENYLDAGAAIEGFLAETCESIPTGTNLDLMLEVLLEGDAKVASVANALNNSGPVLVTGEANSSGTFTNHVMAVPEAGPQNCRVQSKTVAYVGDAPEILNGRDGSQIVNIGSLVACKTVIANPGQPLQPLQPLQKPHGFKGDDIGSLPAPVMPAAGRGGGQ